MARLFTAIDLPMEIKHRLRLFVEPLRPLAKLRWSPIESLHITTKFIGEWPETQLEQLKDALSSVPQNGALEISIGGLGWFPDAIHPHVFWAGVQANRALTQLAQATGEAVANLGVAAELRAYSPHLTLARIGETAKLTALRRAIEDAIEEKRATDFGHFRAGSFSLYHSVEGRYTPLATFPLSSSLSSPLSS